MFSATKGGSPSGYQISRSVRLRSSASAYFNRTPASAGSQTTWTWSGWVKRGALGGTYNLMQAETSSNTYTVLQFSSDNIIFDVRNGGAIVGNKYTSAVYRDPSAWYHIVLVWDTTNATASDRMRVYVNGVRVTAFGTSNDPSSSAVSYGVNGAVAHRIGAGVSFANYFDGYLTEINFIDGQALTPSSFGETNPVTGVWQPKKYTGTYGTNGFYLNFSDNSAATAAAIGADYSGNGNNWTPNNISVTAGVTYDSMLDVPTQWADGGNGRGNYCVLNPLIISGLSGGATLSNGNLRVSGTNGVSNAYARGTMALSGKFYAEFFFDVVNATASIGVDAVTATSGALATSSTSVSYRSGGNKRVLGTESAYGASWVANDIIGVAVDTAANTVEFFKNGVSQGVITSSAFFAQGDCVFAMAKDDLGSPLGYANFGQRPFSYTPPTGFKALNTLNLPTPTILKGNQYFDATTYTGNSGTQSVVNSGAMQPDLVWIKDRSAVGQHVLTDSVRGVDRQLFSSLTNAEQTSATGITSLNSNGFTTGANPSPTGATNSSPDAFIAWQWKEGATQGFDIVTYTGNGSTQAVNHSLGVTPSMVIVKGRSGTGRNWMVQFGSANADRYLMLNSTAAYTIDSTPWNTTNPTSTTFTVGANANTNQSSETFVAYLFASVAGYSAFGLYTGNGSTDGPFVFLGFRPAFIMIKRTDTTGNWTIHDNRRLGYNGSSASKELYPNLSNAEGSDSMDQISNGFKLRDTYADVNASGASYIFAAFAENPFKNALAR